MLSVNELEHLCGRPFYSVGMSYVAELTLVGKQGMLSAQNMELAFLTGDIRPSVA